MSDDERFVQAVVAHPLDAGPRLALADWLDERGDARGPQLRLPGRWRVVRGDLYWDDAVGSDISPASFPLAAVPVCGLRLIAGCVASPEPIRASEVYGGEWACDGCVRRLFGRRAYPGLGEPIRPQEDESAAVAAYRLEASVDVTEARRALGLPVPTPVEWEYPLRRTRQPSERDIAVAEAQASGQDISAFIAALRKSRAFTSLPDPKDDP